MYYQFTVKMNGSGETMEEAWREATEYFALDPGSLPDETEYCELDDNLQPKKQLVPEWISFAFMMEPINTECLCMDEPYEDHEDPTRRDYQDPSCHAQYCPIYLYAYALAMGNGETLPA